MSLQTLYRNKQTDTAVGNRLTQTTQLAVNSYQYDSANRLSNVNSVNYTFDNNGNLLSDGVNTYVYDSANRLISVSNQSSVNSYQYNGLGDRLVQNGTQYTLDLNAGLTQVLSDGTNTYTYGLGRIAQFNTTTEYFLGDALGSVRQLSNNVGDITLAKSYNPYGEVTQTAGSGQSIYAYTGEQTDSTGLTYLRARYYDSTVGRFLSRDTYHGNYNSPLSLNRWNYTHSNPINYTDPSGKCPEPLEQHQECWDYLRQIEYEYPFIDLQSQVNSVNYWELPELVNISRELGLLDQASRIDLNQEFSLGEVSITRIRGSRGILCGTAPSQFQWWAGDRDIELYDIAFSSLGCQATLIHEMAHYWDYRDNLSGKFKKYVGSYNLFWIPFWYITCEDEEPPVYGATLTAKEDFAESLTEYVLLYTNHPRTELIGIEPGGKRWVFIESLLDTGEPPLIP